MKIERYISDKEVALDKLFELNDYFDKLATMNYIEVLKGIVFLNVFIVLVCLGILQSYYYLTLEL